MSRRRERGQRCGTAKRRYAVSSGWTLACSWGCAARSVPASETAMRRGTTTGRVGTQAIALERATHVRRGARTAKLKSAAEHFSKGPALVGRPARAGDRPSSSRRAVNTVLQHARASAEGDPPAERSEGQAEIERSSSEEEQDVGQQLDPPLDIRLCSTQESGGQDLRIDQQGIGIISARRKVRVDKARPHTATRPERPLTS